MDLRFRNLRADEIDARIGSVNQYGVSLLLYKDARCDMNILDETVGAMNWKRSHTRENANCIVSIYNEDLGEWISKEDTGTESNTEKEKGLASDSFKRACVNWGIGRNLYSAPDIFIYKEKLGGLVESNGKYKCYDSFKVSDITYDSNGNIESVSIQVSYKNKVTGTYKFQNTPVATSAPEKPATPASATTIKKPEPASKPTQKPVADTSVLADDEVILLGNCRGKKYGDVKDSDAFKSFLNWVKGTNTTYDNADQNAQLAKFKTLAAAV